MKRGRCTRCNSAYVVAGPDAGGQAVIECLSCGHVRRVDAQLMPAVADVMVDRMNDLERKIVERIFVDNEGKEASTSASASDKSPGVTIESIREIRLKLTKWYFTDERIPIGYGYWISDKLWGFNPEDVKNLIGLWRSIAPGYPDAG